MTVSIYRVEWDAIIAQQFTPAFDEVLSENLHLFDYDATWDAILRDPFVSDLVIPPGYTAPSVIVIEGDQQTELPLEVTGLQPPAIETTSVVKQIEQ